jgi:hypothetical protein
MDEKRKFETGQRGRDDQILRQHVAARGKPAQRRQAKSKHQFAHLFIPPQWLSVGERRHYAGIRGWPYRGLQKGRVITLTGARFIDFFAGVPNMTDKASKAKSPREEPCHADI